MRGTPAAIHPSAPLLGQHNRDLLKEIGVAEAAFKNLLAPGVAAECRPAGKGVPE
jgi:crotonobetainyl-CoA:carnitine CoA-transferase CaiB-like acyl-CoA transferase